MTIRAFGTHMQDIRSLRLFTEFFVYRAVILTGAGSAFCAGGDLKPCVILRLSQCRLTDFFCQRAFNAAKNAPDAPIPAAAFYGLTRDGFGHLSRRSRTTKPIIAAVNGIALGGGMEIVLNCDLVVASQNARFGFVEVRNGLVAVQGGENIMMIWLDGPQLLKIFSAIPRLSRISGYQVGSEPADMPRCNFNQEYCFDQACGRDLFVRSHCLRSRGLRTTRFVSEIPRSSSKRGKRITSIVSTVWSRRNMSSQQL